jgi:hypothetical protein
LIYTPNNTPFRKGTWGELLKWKDKTLNSIDFMAKIRNSDLDLSKEKEVILDLYLAYNPNESGNLDLIEH